MKAGLTGTRAGCSKEQIKGLAEVMKDLTELHHGDCLGVDQQAHHLAKQFDVLTVIHPPSNDKLRAFCEGDFILPPKPYLDRNHDIVEAGEFLIAVPGERQEKVRSGTWATIRHARKLGKMIMIIFPDGSSQLENQ